MTNLNLAHQRLHNQRLAGTKFETPGEVVGWLGAVQSQDYGGGKWAVAQRTTEMTEEAIESAINDGALIRTHVLRPTWHFVTPQDVRWMLKLTAPRVKMKLGYYNRQLELDDLIFARSGDVLAQALRDGKQLTRDELKCALQQASIATDDLRLVHLVANAELEGLICSGAMRGKQFTYALLDDRVPPGLALERDEAVAELTRRYFVSRGYATLQDFIWWSGLTAVDAKAGIDAIKAQLVEELIDGQTFWRSDDVPSARTTASVVYLLPNYDEYIVGYADRSAAYDEQHGDKLDSRGNVLFNNTIVLDGMIVGTWKRTVRKRSVQVEPTLFVALTDAENTALVAAAARYGTYLGLPTLLE